MPRSIELSESSALVLASLMGGPRHGYAIITEVQSQTGKRLGPGTLYGIIARLESWNFICPLDMEDRGRRPYRITAAGRRAFENRLDSLKRHERALKALATS